MKFFIAAIATILVGLVMSGCTKSDTKWSYTGRCLVAHDATPPPWTFSSGVEVNGKEGPGYFSAPLSGFNIAVPEAIDEDLKRVTLRLEVCGTAKTKNRDWSPCRMHSDLMRARTLAKTEGADTGPEAYGLRVGNLPYFSAVDGSFVGKCAIAELHQLGQTSLRDPCQIWLPGNDSKTGISATIAAAALPHAIMLMREARFLFRPELASCAITYEHQ